MLIRPSKYSLKKNFEQSASLWGRERALPSYRRALRALATRLRAQKVEKEKAGVPAAEARLDRARDELWEIGKVIEALPLSFTTGAALAFIGFTNQMTKDQTVAGTSGSEEFVICLRAMRPHLTGPFAADVDDMLANLDRHPCLNAGSALGRPAKRREEGAMQNTLLLMEDGSEPPRSRRGFLRTLIAAPAALATHRLVAPPPIVTLASAQERVLSPDHNKVAVAMILAGPTFPVAGVD